MSHQTLVQALRQALHQGEHDLAAELMAAVVFPLRKNRKKPRKYDPYEYQERHLIECLFNKMKQYRRVFSRFDKLARNYWSFCCFVCTLLWLR